MGELKTANHLIGDRVRLEAAMEGDGYWFFRDVLDRVAVSELRSAYVHELARQGAIDAHDPTAKSNGRPLDTDAFAVNLRNRSLWRAFVSNPNIDAVFRAILGEQPFWIPNVRTRATPPQPDRGEERLVFIHQDGAFNPGIPFFVTWVPLASINQSMGGLALAEGMHHRGSLHTYKDGLLEGIELNAIPADRWRRSDYQPGDLLMMNVMTPHSGMSNISDRFRFSIDLRSMRSSANVPLIGTVAAIDENHLTVRDRTGETSLEIDDATYCSSFDGKKIPRRNIPVLFPVGMSVIVGRDGRRATVVRPPTE
jgi:hypothetical protein